MELLKLITDALGPGGLGNLISAIIASIGPGGLTAILIIGTFAITRELNKRGPISGERLVDKLMADLSAAISRESDCAKQVAILTRRVETLEREKASLEERLEREKAALEARIDALVSLFQSGGINTYPKQDETEIGKMRRWMFEHMNEESLTVAAADAGLAKPKGESVEVQILSLVDEARRLNLLPKLSSVIQARLPTVKPW
mgnify:FL=1